MENLKIGIVGLGWFGRKHLSAWRGIKGVEIVGAADKNAKSIKACISDSAQAKFHADDSDTISIDFPVYETADELLANHKLDALDIVVDEASHYPIAKMALEKNLPIIVEKPFVLEYRHALDLARIAKEKGLNIYVGHILRFDKRVQYIRDRIRRGSLGDIAYMSFKRNFQRQAHNVYGRVSPFFSGLVHDIDMAIWFSGSDVVDAKGISKSIMNKENPDVLIGIIEFKNNLLCRVENVWHVGKSCPYGFENELAVYGSKETIISRTQPIVEVWGEDKVEYPEFFFWPYIMGERGGALKEMLEHYAECIRNNAASPIVPIEDVLKVIEVCEKLKGE